LQANATGHSAKTVLEFLEKYYTTEEVTSEKGAVKLAIRALLEVVQSGLKNLEVAVMRRGAPLEVCKSSFTYWH
jgi:20S proteasome subunit alpha 4